MNKKDSINIFLQQKLIDTERVEELLTIKEASEWATNYTGKKVTVSNISYLIQYGIIKKHKKNGSSFISIDDLINYYNSQNFQKQSLWKKQLGEDLNWALSFEQYKESETTKHVHRLHPYKGKFIPQLVEYFLDDHTDNFKNEIYFQPGDVILDPFCGSGTTLVQANELGIHAVGIDISEFNTLISNCKIEKYNLIQLKREIDHITETLKKYLSDSHTLELDEKLSQILAEFNNQYFPVPDFKHKLKSGEIDEEKYGYEKEQLFLNSYYHLINEYEIKLKQDREEKFVDKWYILPIRNEIELVRQEIEKIDNHKIKNLLRVVLSRTARSCRATTHSDLATLKEPVIAPYYCSKHGKICKPLFSILKWWQTYTSDTIKRLSQFEKLKTNTFQICLTGDSRTIDIIQEVESKLPELAEIIKNRKIKGIFSSPPYVGLIDYHEQHAYAYDLFGFERRDDKEIGPLFKGQSKIARENYVEGIAMVLLNCKKYLVDDYNVFLVANDKYNLYPIIADKARMKIVNQFKRPVLNRSEKDKNAYSEIIFHLKEK